MANGIKREGARSQSAPWLLGPSPGLARAWGRTVSRTEGLPSAGGACASAAVGVGPADLEGGREHVEVHVRMKAEGWDFTTMGAELACT